MTEHGIIFTGQSPTAIRERRKFVSRRISKRWLKVKAGDRLWVLRVGRFHVVEAV